MALRSDFHPSHRSCAPRASVRAPHPSPSAPRILFFPADLLRDVEAAVKRVLRRAGHVDHVGDFRFDQLSVGDCLRTTGAYKPAPAAATNHRFPRRRPLREQAEPPEHLQPVPPAGPMVGARIWRPRVAPRPHHSDLHERDRHHRVRRQSARADAHTARPLRAPSLSVHRRRQLVQGDCRSCLVRRAVQVPGLVRPPHPPCQHPPGGTSASDASSLFLSLAPPGPHAPPATLSGCRRRHRSPPARHRTASRRDCWRPCAVPSGRRVHSRACPQRGFRSVFSASCGLDSRRVRLISRTARASSQCSSVTCSSVYPPSLTGPLACSSGARTSRTCSPVAAAEGYADSAPASVVEQPSAPQDVVHRRKRPPRRRVRGDSSWLEAIMLRV